MTADWRSRGTYRVTLEFPLDDWKAFVAEAERVGVKPSVLLRDLVRKAVAAEAHVARGRSTEVRS